MSGLAAIFDLDGTLVDSFEAHSIAWGRMGERHGVPITPEQFERHFGRRNEQMLREIWLEAGRGELSDADIARLDHEKEALYRELVADGFPVMDGGLELLNALRSAGWRLAVGSSAPPENVAVAIDGLGAHDLFHATVSGRDVRLGKPEPECFLLAAERLGVPPSRCVVVEDAPAGITAALRAGMRCVAITSKGHRPERQRDAHLVVRSLRELSPDSLAALVAVS
jgi:beta-phosphoglucomutase